VTASSCTRYTLHPDVGLCSMPTPASTYKIPRTHAQLMDTCILYFGHHVKGVHPLSAPQCGSGR
jgi:hypothetical protein